MNYIQNKLDELIETYRKENYSEYDVRMVAERLATDYNNHIVEKIKELPAFTSCSDKTMGKVSDEAKVPMYGTHYLEHCISWLGNRSEERRVGKEC